MPHRLVVRAGGRVGRAVALSLSLLVLCTFTPRRAVAQSCPAPPAPIAPGQTLSGALAATDCHSTQFPANYADRYRVSLVAGTRYRVNFSATAYDPYLFLFGPSGSVVLQDDDSGPENDAALTFVASTTGAYVLELTSLGPTATGPYTIAVADDASCASPAIPIAAGQTIAGAIANTDCLSAVVGGAYFDTYTFTAVAGEQYKINMKTTGSQEALDSYLVLRNPSGSVVARDNDSGMFIDARIVHDAAVSGTYTIEATGYGPSEIGTYSISLDSGTCSSTTTPIAFGQTLDGALATTDCFGDATSQTYSYVDHFTFHADVGNQIRVVMHSTAFASVFYVKDPSGTVVTATSDGGEGSDAALNYTVLSSGTYTIDVTSFGFESTGPYTVSLGLLGSPPHACTPTTTPIAAGQGVTGEIVNADCYGTVLAGSLADTYSLAATAGVQYSVTLTSIELNPWLVLKDPSGAVVRMDNDSGGGWNARIVFTAATTGTYTIEATTLYASDTGAYQLTVFSGNTTCTSTVATIAVGDTRSETLAPTDCVGSVRTNAYHDTFTFSVAAGQTVVVTMSSTAFDTYLNLLDGDAVLVSNDDASVATLDSQIRYTPQAGATLTVDATSFSPFAIGAYTLSVTAAGPCGSSTTPIALGETLSGALALTDCRSETVPTSFVDTFTFAGTANTAYEIAVRSFDFDAYLVVKDETGAVVATDDDGGGGFDALTRFTPAANGTYRIEATSSNADATGDYTVTFREAPFVGPCTSSTTAITPGQSLSGSLSVTDCASANVQLSYSDRFTFDAVAGTRYAVDLRSAAFDSWLAVLDPSGAVVVESDDSAGTSNSHVSFVAATSGTYTLEAASYPWFQVGAYTVALAVESASCVPTASPLAVGASVAGSLDDADCYGTVRSYARADAYAIVLNSGDQVVIDMSSEAFDTWLVLKSPNGGIVAQNDDLGYLTDSEIAFTASASGTYVVEATSFEPGATGAYTLSLASGPPAGRAARLAPKADAVGNASQRTKDGIGVVAPNGAWFLRDANSPGAANRLFAFGAGGASVVSFSGDWDGDGDDSPGFYDRASGAFFLSDKSANGPADRVFVFGPASTTLVPLAGDWDGDGVDSVGLYDPATGAFFLTNKPRGGAADLVFLFGPGGAGWKPIVGDWNGDGIDTVGLFAPSSGAFFLKDTNAGGGADRVFTFGAGGATLRPLAGDWDARGADGVGLYNPATGIFFLKNATVPGPADYVFGFGPSGLAPVTGDWDGR